MCFTECVLTGSLLHNIKQETTPIIVIKDKIMMLDEAINNVSRWSAAPSKFPSSSSHIDVCTDGDSSRLS